MAQRLAGGEATGDWRGACAAGAWLGPVSFAALIAQPSRLGHDLEMPSGAGTRDAAGQRYSLNSGIG
jgi:hypothetical protein